MTSQQPLAPLPLTFDEQVDRMEEQSLKVPLTCEERADVQRRADAGEVPSWSEVKRYEATVVALEAELKGLSKDYANLLVERNALEARVAQLEEEIARLNDVIADARADLSDISANIKASMSYEA